MRIGTTELMLILAVVLIIFGPKQLPKLAKMFGKASKSFKEGIEEGEEEEEPAAKPVKKAVKAENSEDDE